mgnify:CR=1 FL=1
MKPAPVVLITGAAAGIGLATVRRLVKDGWRCVAAGETTIDEVVRMVSEDDGA